ncbi:MAG: NAD(P)H-hydrate epimerase [Bdellovibrionota bacterium]
MNEEFIFSDEHVFTTKAGLKFPGFKAATVFEMQQALLTELHISELQTCEAASYSLAMVVRFALGLSADGGAVTAVVDNTLAGCVVLGTARHLRNAGAVCHIICLNNPAESSEIFQRFLKPLEIMKVDITQLGISTSIEDLSAKAANSHNALLGVYGSSNSQIPKIADSLNELSTPIHCVSCPPGIDPDTGSVLNSPLFASSTLSLGAPFQGLNLGRDYVGRHYICDVSIPAEVYLRNGFDLSGLFSEQPVSQILPFSAEEDEEA